MMQKGVDATTTVCHSATENLAEITRKADIIIAALGRPGFVTADMVKEGATVIDVGTTRVPDSSRKSGFRLCGDVDFENVAPKCAFITPGSGRCRTNDNSIPDAEYPPGRSRRDILMCQGFIVLFSLLSLLFGYDEAEIVFAGDAMMHKAQIEAARQNNGSYDFNEYFSEIDGYIGSADYAVVNLETPVSAPPHTGYPCFNAPEQYIDALADAGFDLFLTANNHTLDRRDRGLVSTIENLDKRNLDHIGTYKDSEERSSAMPFIKTINNIKVAFMNYTYGTNGIAPRQQGKGRLYRPQAHQERYRSCSQCRCRIHYRMYPLGQRISDASFG